MGTVARRAGVVGCRVAVDFLRVGTTRGRTRTGGLRMRGASLCHRSKLLALGTLQRSHDTNAPYGEAELADPTVTQKLEPG
jgi:hypothetical protein